MTDRICEVENKEECETVEDRRCGVAYSRQCRPTQEERCETVTDTITQQTCQASQEKRCSSVRQLQDITVNLISKHVGMAKGDVLFFVKTLWLSW